MHDEEYIKQVAAQLRKPTGELGNQVAEMMNTGNLMMNQNTIKALDIKANDSVLEIGMGNGFFVKEILSKSPGVSYLGCDYSQEMVKASEVINRIYVKKGYASFHQADANNLPAKKASVNVLFTINTLYFWDDPSAVLDECKRILKLNGTFVLSFRPSEALKMYPTTKYGFNFFSEKEAQQLLIDHGFQIISSTKFEEPSIEIDGKRFPPKHVIIVASSST